MPIVIKRRTLSGNSEPIVIKRRTIEPEKPSFRINAPAILEKARQLAEPAVTNVRQSVEALPPVAEVKAIIERRPSPVARATMTPEIGSRLLGVPEGMTAGEQFGELYGEGRRAEKMSYPARFANEFAVGVGGEVLDITLNPSTQAFQPALKYFGGPLARAAARIPIGKTTLGRIMTMESNIPGVTSSYWERLRDLYKKGYVGPDIAPSNPKLSWGNMYRRNKKAFNDALKKRGGNPQPKGLLEPPGGLQKPIVKDVLLDPDKKLFIHETNQEFTKFDMSKIGSGQGESWLGKGIYLNEKGGFKFETYGKNKIKAKLNPDAKIFEVKNTPDGPYRDNFVEWAVNNKLDGGLAQMRIKEGLSLNNLLPRDIFKVNPSIVDKLKAGGFDGLLQDGELVIYNDKSINILNKPSNTPPPTGQVSQPVATKKKIERFPFKSKINLPEKLAREVFVFDEGDTVESAILKTLKYELSEGVAGGKIYDPEEGRIVGGYGSTYQTLAPYFADKGYSFENVASQIDRVLSGQPITKINELMLNDLIDGIINQHIKEFEAYERQERELIARGNKSEKTEIADPDKGLKGTQKSDISPSQNVVEETPAGKQILLEGTPQREFPNTKLKPKKAQAEDELGELKASASGQNAAQGKLFASKEATPIDAYEKASGSSGIDKYEQQVKAAGKIKDFKLFDEFRKLGNKYASILGESYIQLPHALGTYNPTTDTVRTVALNAASTNIHEFAHAIDHKYQFIDSIIQRIGTAKNGNPIYDPKTLPIRKEMTKLYVQYYGGARAEHELAKKMREGFATFIQKYIEMPTSIKENYPNLVREFLTQGGKYHKPIIDQYISEVRSIVQKYQALDPLYKIGAKVTTDPQRVVKDSYLNLVEKVNTFWADNVYPVSKLAAEGGVGMTAQDPSLWLRQYNNSNALILNNIKGDKGYWTISGDSFKKIHDFNWKTVIEKIQEKGKTDDFGYWLVARDQHFQYLELDKLKEAAIQASKELKTLQKELAESGEGLMVGVRDIKEAIEEAKKTIESYKHLRRVLANNGFSREIVAKAYEDYREMFKEEAGMFDKLTRADLNLLHDSKVGLVTDKQYAEYVKKEGYASLKRDIYDEVLGEGEQLIPIRVGKTRVSSVIGRKGSELTIINPLYNAIRNHAEITRKALKQIVWNKVGALSPKMPDIIMEVPLKRSYDPRTGKTTYPQDKDSNILMARDSSGKRKPYLVNAEVKRAIDEVLEFRNIGIFEDLLTRFNRIFTKGTTAIYAPFSVTNFTIDQITAVAQTRNKLVPIYDSLNTILKKAKYSVSQKLGMSLPATDDYKFLEEYLVMGGEKQTFVGWQDMNPSDLFKMISGEQSALHKVLNAIETGEDWLAILSKNSEIGTRAAEYIRSRKSGKPQIVALEEAGEVTAPFHHVGTLGGATGKTIIKSIPFFSPSIQVLAKSLRTLSGSPGYTSNKKAQQRFAYVVLAVTASLLGSQYYLFKKGTRKQIQQYKDLQPEELAQNIFFPNPSGDGLIKVRVSQEMSGVGTIINMALANHYENADYTVGDFVAAGTQFLPSQFNVTDPVKAFYSWIPQLIKPLIEVTANIRTFPKVLPLEGMGQQRKSPGQRFTETTLPVPKWVGEKLNISPIKFQHLFLGYLGRAARPLLGEVPFTGKSQYNPLVKKYYFEYGRMMQKYYDTKEKNDQRYSDQKNGRIKITGNELSKLLTEKTKLKIIDSQLDIYKKHESDSLRNSILNLIEDLND